MNIPLEDTWLDVVGKAMRGHQIDSLTLAETAGVPPEAVEKLMEGALDMEVLGAVAGCLGLHPVKLAKLARNGYHPAPLPQVEGLLQFNTPFGDMTVNSYLVWDPNTKLAAAFDTGSDSDGMLQAVADRGLQLENIFLTHSHGDHVLDLDRMVEKTGSQAWISEKEPLEGARTFAAGEEFGIGGLTVRTFQTWGHSAGGVTYAIHGLQLPVAVVGDAIFAGSAGGGQVNYVAALATVRAHVLSLPDETVLCPGHGPMTTVAEQKDVNPFF